MCSLAASSAMISSKQAIAGPAVARNGPFTSARPAAVPRNVVAKAQQGPNEAAMRAFGAIGAVQIALLPLTGAAVAGILPDTSDAAKAEANRKTDAAPTLGEVGKALTNFEGARDKAPNVADPAQKAADKGREVADNVAKAAPSNPARDFANRAKQAVSANPSAFAVGDIGQKAIDKTKSVAARAKAVGAPDAATTLAEKTKSAARDAKASLGPNGVPDPVKDLQNKAKKATKQVANPAKEFAAKAQKNVKKAPAVAKPQVNKAKAAIANPAKEFVRKAEQAKNKAPSLLAIGFDTEGLQKNVLFGFGEKKVKQAASDAKDAAGDVKQAAGDVAQKVDENTPSSFSIFDADSVNDAKNKLRENLDAAVSQQSDPAQRVASVGKPGETQEENAERIRREAENGAPAGGDARAPTANASP